MSEKSNNRAKNHASCDCGESNDLAKSECSSTDPSHALIGDLTLRLSPEENRVRAFFLDYVSRHSRAPDAGIIVRDLGLASLQDARDLLSALESERVV